MKKFLALLLVMMLIMTSFTACGSKDDGEIETPDTNLEQDVEAGGDEVEGDAEADAEDAEGDAEADKEDEPAKEEDKKEESADKKEEQKPADSKPADKPESDKKEENKKEEDKKEEKPSSGNSGAASVSGTPAEIIDMIYEKAPAVEFPLGTIEIDINDADALMMFTGLSSADKISAAAASEAMMGSQAYSLVVVKVKDAKNAESVATEMMNGIDQRKWICVEADDLRVAAAGDTVVLMMVDSEYAATVTAKDVIDAFGSVAGGLDLNKAK